MSSGERPTAAPFPTPTWQDPDCHCGTGHRPHVGGHCPQAGCSCYVEAPTCAVCFHRDHGYGEPCYARGIKDTRACICRGPGATTRKELEDHEIFMARIK